ncbi:sciellin isoform X2 [Betta splendens]|uniref:Sciellin isoform X2 n=1 Tax=Betta splendens TaxID=158456 RepID=A0A6P7LF94_BETSP|nr:sciellin isoform X2 [Betta splendens]
MSKSSKTNLLQDNSWIRRANKSEDTVEQDPNFGRSVLKGNTSSETLVSPDGDELTRTKTTSTSVQSLSKRFGGSPDDLKSSGSLSSSKTTTSSTKYSYSTVKSDSPVTTTKTIISEKPMSSTTTTTITKNGTSETTVTTTESVSSSVLKSPTSTETFSQRVKASSKDPQYSTYSPSRTTKVTETTITGSKDAEDKSDDIFNLSDLKDDPLPSDSKSSISTIETVRVKSSSDANVEDKLYDTLLPRFIKNDVPSRTTISSTETVTVKSSSDTEFKDKLYDTRLSTVYKDDAPSSKSSISSSETVTVRSSPSGDGVKTTTTIRTSSRSDDFNDTYLPRTTTSSVSSPYSSDKTFSYSRPDTSYEYTSITSPSSYSSSVYRSSSSRSDDILSDPIYSRSSIKNVYASPERTVLEKDLCTSCRKPFTGDAKIVLEEMNIKCHASCFKCEECNYNLGGLKAGDSMWVYRRRVHCENCFEATRAKWRR